MLVKRDGTIFDVNRLEKGYTREMVIGQSVFNENWYETKNQVEAARKQINYVFQSGKRGIFEYSQRAPDGSLSFYETSIAPFEQDAEDGIKPVQFATRDITERKKAEEEFKKNVDGSFEFRWLAERGGEKSISPEFKNMESSLEKSPKKSVILLDSLDYLVLKNGFKETLFFMQRLRERTYFKGNVVILSIDPATLSTREIRQLEKEGGEVEPQVLVRLPEDLFEILRFVYEHNAMGSKPNYTDIRQELSVSKPTVGKRIKILVNTGYVTENLRGNSKVLELTHKGTRLFIK